MSLTSLTDHLYRCDRTPAVPSLATTITVVAATVTSMVLVVAVAMAVAEVLPPSSVLALNTGIVVAISITIAVQGYIISLLYHFFVILE